MAVVGQRTPGSHRLLNADAEKGEERFGEDRARNQERHRNDDRPHRVGQQMAQQNLPKSLAPASLRGEGVLLMLETAATCERVMRAVPTQEEMTERNQDGAARSSPSTIISRMMHSR